MTVMGFPRTSSTPGEMCAVELDFPRASVPPGESCAETRGYIKSTWLAGSPVCAWMVTGSLRISPHTCTGLFPLDVAQSSAVRRVCSCYSSLGEMNMTGRNLAGVDSI